MILVYRHIVPKGYLGITLFPFVFLKSSDLKHRKFLINHENIHLRQQLELLVIPFYLIYLVEFFIRLIKYRNWKLAYKNISFEREAYKNEKNLSYLKSRSFWTFIKYYNVRKSLF
jgi:hypothetical protein